MPYIKIDYLVINTFIYVKLKLIIKIFKFKDLVLLQ